MELADVPLDHANLRSLLPRMRGFHPSPQLLERGCFQPTDAIALPIHQRSKALAIDPKLGARLVVVGFVKPGKLLKPIHPNPHETVQIRPVAERGSLFQVGPETRASPSPRCCRS